MTATTKHTPGPWQTDCYLTVRTQQGTSIAQALSKYTTLDEAPHNARLIAAAPELLDALRKADAWVAQYHTLSGHERASECMSRVIRAALTKACGEG